MSERKVLSVNMPKDLWVEFVEVAQKERHSPSTVMKRLIREYVADAREPFQDETVTFRACLVEGEEPALEHYAVGDVTYCGKPAGEGSTLSAGRHPGGDPLVCQKCYVPAFLM